jgi:hypothetical protein
MSDSRHQSDTRPDDLPGPQGSIPRIDWFRFAAVPSATWLTQLMASQKVIEAMWRQGILTADMLRPGSGVALRGATDPSRPIPAADWPSRQVADIRASTPLSRLVDDDLER